MFIDVHRFSLIFIDFHQCPFIFIQSFPNKDHHINQSHVTIHPNHPEASRNTAASSSGTSCCSSWSAKPSEWRGTRPDVGNMAVFIWGKKWDSNWFSTEMLSRNGSFGDFQQKYGGFTGVLIHGNRIEPTKWGFNQWTTDICVSESSERAILNLIGPIMTSRWIWV